MRLSEVPKLDAMLQISQEPVCLDKPVAVGFVDIAMGGKCIQSINSSSASQIRIESAVDELQQLGGELDVSYPAAGSLDVVGVRVLLSLILESPDAAQSLGVKALIPDHAGSEFEKPRSEFTVAGTESRLQQSLELPGLGPLVVVALVPVEASGEWPHCSFRSQAGVDLEGRSVERGG